MKIKEYIDYTGLSVRSFAKVVEVSAQQVYSWYHGAVPRKLMLEKLKRLTSGMIAPEDYGFQKKE